ncbi:unnamed protein product [Pleuronectes platessa]|uniref:Alpha-carbonic anhydrase domain-containing protein n=1 Tax=Pleuronectes platessa TaxID=8262 RepID=A0A9N7UIM5_PLEPL|nr:unnamed protein product [Pleuronectes platessa]
MSNKIEVTGDFRPSEKETFLEPFVLKDLLPSALGSYYRYTGSLTTPPCSKVVEWIIFSRPIYVSYKQAVPVPPLYPPTPLHTTTPPHRTRHQADMLLS